MNRTSTPTSAIFFALALGTIVAAACSEQSTRPACSQIAACPEVGCCKATTVCDTTICQGERWVCRQGGDGVYAWQKSAAQCEADAGPTPDAVVIDAEFGDTSAPDQAAPDVSITPDVGVKPDAKIPKDSGGCNWGSNGENGDSCSGVPTETWRCVQSATHGVKISQVCRNNKWSTFNLKPRACNKCCGDYSVNCKAL